MIRFSNVRKEIKYPRELWIAKEPEFYFFLSYLDINIKSISQKRTQNENAKSTLQC